MSIVNLQTQTIETSKVDGIINVTTFYQNSPNNPPTGQSISIDNSWNALYTFNSVIITDNVTDNEGDSIISIKLINIPILGTLTYQGAKCIPGLELPITNINQLIWIPPTGLYGNNIASFDIQVKDNGIPPNEWSDQFTITFNLIKDNLEPSVSNSNIITNYNNRVTITVNDLLNNYNDPEGDPAGFIVINTLPPSNHGVLYFDNEIIQANQLPLRIFIADISNEKLEYLDTGEITNQKSIFIDYTVEDNII